MKQGPDIDELSAYMFDTGNEEQLGVVFCVDAVVVFAIFHTRCNITSAPTFFCVYILAELLLAY